MNTLTPATHPKVDEIREAIQETGKPYTLADAIREGGSFCEQAYNWQDGERVCAWSAALVAMRARDII